MRPRKCPRCELNYILEGEELCSVCRKAMHGTEPDELENICVECGTNPALPGEDFCKVCLAARKKREAESIVPNTDEDVVDDEMEELTDNGEEIEELEIEVPDEEIPETELAQIEDDLDYDEDLSEDEASDEWDV